MNRFFTVNARYGKVVLNIDGIKKYISEKQKNEEKKGFRVLTKKNK